MKEVRATWRNGRIEVDEPVDWPEGCRLLVEPDASNGAVGVGEASQENTPEAIAQWLAWYDSLEPLVFTPEEEADIAAWRRTGRCRRRGGVHPFQEENTLHTRREV